MNNYSVDRAKWAQQDIFSQMGNIYAEVGRTFSAQRRGDSAMAEAAAVRAFDLFDATSENLAAQKSPKLFEVLRAREQFASVFVAGGGDVALESYFANFALAVRTRQLV